MTFGFVLRRLIVSGPGVKDAVIDFKRGLNVIAGPSDTGKTFIAQCINFVLGSSKAPKEIPQARQYSSIALLIESSDNVIYSLERGLRAGEIRLTTEGEQERVLDTKNDSDDSVSAFLLALSGLADRKVRTNQQGKTRPLSFRDIVRLILVDEESVITSLSPVLTGQYTGKTVESSVFRLLLTGVDDSSVIARLDPKIAKGRQEGKAEILELLLHQSRDQLFNQKVEGGITEVREQLERLDAAYVSASAELNAEQINATTLEERRRDAWGHLRKVESRADVLSELQKRFELLKEQYSSDLRRLDAIAEAGLRLDQMTEERCPVCGAPAEHHAAEHQQARSKPADVAQSSRAEAAKTARLLADLQITLASNASEVTQLVMEQKTRKAELDAASSDLKILIQPRLQLAVQKLRDSQSERDKCRRALELLERVQDLERLLVEAQARQKKQRAEGPSANVSSGEAEFFSQQVQSLLQAWHFPGLERVTFSEEDQDIVISGIPRASRGKGVRAITRAAFNLGLLQVCAREDKAFPRWMLIDSPLVVYREPDPGEGGFPLDVKDAFYRSIAKDFLDSQVIILENDDPPADLYASANIILFTGTGQGRNGFIPSPSSGK
jgi:hypothetical protein